MGITQQIGASSLIKPGVIDNTAARPASPYEGQVIYQKDTDAVLVYNGTAWYPNWNTAWGIVALTTSTSTDTFTTAEKVMLTSTSFTAVANRYYKITYFEPSELNSVATGESATNLRLTNISGAIQQTSNLWTTSVVYASQTCQVITTLSAGTTTICATQTAAAGTTTCRRSSTNKAFIMVEDIGPA